MLQTSKNCGRYRKGYRVNNSKNPTALQSQRWILQALLDLMENTAYDKISVSEICRKAEVDRRTFYRNFDSKNEVLEHHIKSLSNEYMAEFNRINFKDRYAATLLFFEFWERHISFIQNVKNCGLSDFLFSHFEQFVKAYQSLLIGTEVTDTQIDYIFAYRIGGFWNVMLTWAADNANISPVELADIIYRS